MATKSKSLQFHLLCWAVFIIYDSLIGGMAAGRFGAMPNYVIHYALNIALFYFHAHFILKKGLGSRHSRIIKTVLLLGLEIALYIFLVFYIDSFLARHTNYLSVKVITFSESLVYGYLWRSLYFIFVSTGYFFFIEYIRERNENDNVKKQQFDMLIRQEQIDKQLAEAKNAFLLAQVNPHFLFNTLNYIYFSTYKASPKGAEAIMALSKIMRYTADTENTKESVKLGTEIEHIENLLYLNNLRLNGLINFKFQYTPDVKEIRIIPLVLITIAENIFKHAHLTHSDYPPFIRIKNESAQLIITSGNMSKEPIYNHDSLSSGLSNLVSRIEFAYGNNAEIYYGKDNKNYFSLQLKIPIR
ncbi:sensor histidine kinase [Pedobacter chinensis]|uniref:sensor histidine kinase n=1 Tax=Pedobacter chinensis TaxID=2282421 RepID=UPI001314FB96|nr:sensor histidine kinase [Pedobacter chinensis]